MTTQTQAEEKAKELNALADRIVHQVQIENTQNEFDTGFETLKILIQKADALDWLEKQNCGFKWYARQATWDDAGTKKAFVGSLLETIQKAQKGQG